MDFGGQVFDPDQFEKELFSKINKIELRKVEEDDITPFRTMENNLGNISCIPRMQEGG